jgi:hypothetical protein
MVINSLERVFMRQEVVMNVQAVASYRPWYCGSINRGIVKVHMSHFLTAYPTDPVPELSNALTH